MHAKRPLKKAASLLKWRQRLEQDHVNLEKQIWSEEKRALPDSLKLQQLKRERLMVKEGLLSVEGVLRTLNKPAQVSTGQP